MLALLLAAGYSAADVQKFFELWCPKVAQSGGAGPVWHAVATRAWPPMQQIFETRTWRKGVPGMPIVRALYSGDARYAGMHAYLGERRLSDLQSW
jgi:hypothetical protein